MVCEICLASNIELASIKCYSCSTSWNICKGCFHFFRYNNGQTIKYFKCSHKDPSDIKTGTDINRNFNSISEEFLLNDFLEPNEQPEFENDWLRDSGGGETQQLSNNNFDSSRRQGEINGWNEHFISHQPRGITSFDLFEPSAPNSPLRTLDLARSGEWEPQSENSVKSVWAEIGLITWNINHFNTSPVQVDLYDEQTNQILEFLDNEITERKEEIKKLNQKTNATRFSQLSAELNTIEQEIVKTKKDAAKSRKELIAKKTAAKDEKRRKKKLALPLLFRQHSSWLDCLVLQEINESNVSELKQALADDRQVASGFQLKLVLGPKMTNIGLFSDEDKGADSEIQLKMMLNNVVRRLTKKQQEYYPIIYRADKLEHLGSNAYYDSERANSGNEQFCYWSKNQDIINNFTHRSCRPIIVHCLRQKETGQTIYVAVVHTSPKGDGLGRQGEFEQIQSFLKFVKEEQDKHECFWIIAGDFYLDPEAVVTSNSDVKKRPKQNLFKNRVEKFNLNLITITSSTNQSKLDRAVTRKRQDALGERSNLTEKIRQKPDLIFDYLADREKQLLQAIFTKLRASGKSENIPAKVKQLYQNIKKKPLVSILSCFTKTQRPRVKKLLELIQCFSVEPEGVFKFVGLTKPFAKLKIDSTERLISDGEIHVVNKRADFFMATRNLQFYESGLINPAGDETLKDGNNNNHTGSDNNNLSPRSGGALLSFDERNQALNWWMKISDHAPVGAIFSTRSDSPKITRFRADTRLLLQAAWQQAMRELDKIYKFALDEIVACLQQLDQKLSAEDWSQSPNSFDQGFTEPFWVAKYCFYLLCVLREWDADYYQFKIEDYEFARTRSLPANVTPDDLKKIMQHYIKAAEEQTPLEKAQNPSYVTLVKKTLISLEALGYRIADFDLTPEVYYFDFDEYVQANKSAEREFYSELLGLNNNSATDSQPKDQLVLDDQMWDTETLMEIEHSSFFLSDPLKMEID